MNEETKKWLTKAGMVLGIIFLLFMIPKIEEAFSKWSKRSSAQSASTEKKDYDPVPSDSNRRTVSLNENVWTRFKCPTEGSRRNFRCDRVDPNLWIEYRSSDDNDTIIVLPPKNHSAYKPVVINPGIGKKVKYDMVRVHKHTNNPPNRDVEIYYVE